MYTQTFALRGFPFEPDIATDQMFDARCMAESQARLAHLVDLRGIGLLTGEVGAGKTAACRRFLDGLPRGLYSQVYLTIGAASPLEACNSLAVELGLPAVQSRSAARRAIQAELSRRAGNRQTPVVVIDEAHLLSNQVLEELRLLTNFAIDSEQRFCLLMVGLTTLRQRLAMAVNESLAQRLVVRHHVDGLTQDEVEAYIRHRLSVAGAPDVPLFEANAFTAVAQAAHGLPRRVNQIAHNALAAAAVDKARTVTIDHVAQASEELGLRRPP